MITNAIMQELSDLIPDMVSLNICDCDAVTDVGIWCEHASGGFCSIRCFHVVCLPPSPYTGTSQSQAGGLCQAPAFPTHAFALTVIPTGHPPPSLLSSGSKPDCEVGVSNCVCFGLVCDPLTGRWRARARR